MPCLDCLATRRDLEARLHATERARDEALAMLDDLAGELRRLREHLAEEQRITRELLQRAIRERA